MEQPDRFHKGPTPNPDNADKNHADAVKAIRAMMDQDRFSQWMGLVIDECGSGYCRLHYTITEDMLNGFGIVHGGILFSAADSAFAFACNSHGSLTVALDANIHYARPARTGEVLTVEAKEIHLGSRTGIYEVRTTNAESQLVALFKGTSYRTSRELQ
jgi:acyl-CoA thioesterase